MQPSQSQNAPSTPIRGGKPSKAVTMSQAIARLDACHDSRKIAGAILEVLGGARSTTDAASALSVSLPRYYALEARAIEGLVKACEPRKRGRSRPPEKEIDRLQKEVKKLESECARAQSIARAAQRTLGLAPPAPKVSDPSGTKRSRKRRPAARALVAAKALAKGPERPAASASPAAPGGGAS